MTQQLVTGSDDCTVCGQSMTGKAGVNDAKGRPVCGDCIEAARQLVARRESRKRQVEQLKKSEHELARVEHDNTAVLQMSEEDVLALSRFACKNCGRVLPVAGLGCEACGYGTTLGIPTKRRARFFSLKFSGPSSQASALFPQFDSRIVTWAGTGAMVLGALTPLVAMLVRWMWEGAIVLALGLTIAAMGLMGYARRSSPVSIGAPAIGGVAVCVLLLRGLGGPTSQSLMAWLAVGVAGLGLQLWGILSGHDEWLVRRSMWASLVAQAGLMTCAIIRCSQVG